MKDVSEYLDNWNEFMKLCEKRAKDADCHINSKGWQRLKEFHLARYLREVENPFGFLFNIRYRKPKVYASVKCMSRHYHKELARKKLENSSIDYSSAIRRIKSVNR